MPFADPARQREYDRQKYVKNRDKIIARSTKRHFDNHEERLTAMRGYYYETKADPVARVVLLSANAINRAQREGIIFQHDIIAFLSKAPPSHCPLCSQELDYTLGRGTGPDARRASPSIDRMIPELGYVVDNVWIICTECNGKKWTYTDAEWLPQTLPIAA